MLKVSSENILMKRSHVCIGELDFENMSICCCEFTQVWS